MADWSDCGEAGYGAYGSDKCEAGDGNKATRYASRRANGAEVWGARLCDSPQHQTDQWRGATDNEQL